MLNRHLFNEAINLKLDLLRVDAHTRYEIANLLKNLEKELLSKLILGVDTLINQARIKKQLDEINKIISSKYIEASNLNLSHLEDVAHVSATSAHSALIAATNGEVPIEVLPTLNYLNKIASNSMIQGASIKDWWARQSDDVIWRFKTAVQQGLVAAESTNKIISRVRTELDISKRNAMTLVRTSVQQVANDARMEVFKDNSDVIDALEWVATLDLSTCESCGPRDGLTWSIDGKSIDNSIPFEQPPLHFGCRCVMVAALAPGAEKGTRASMYGQIEDTRFSKWLEGKTEAQQNEVLGVGRAQLWRDNKITLEQLLDQKGNPMTLSELKSKYL